MSKKNYHKLDTIERDNLHEIDYKYFVLQYVEWKIELHSEIDNINMVKLDTF